MDTDKYQDEIPMANDPSDVVWWTLSGGWISDW